MSAPNKQKQDLKNTLEFSIKNEKGTFSIYRDDELILENIRLVNGRLDEVELGRLIEKVGPDIADQVASAILKNEEKVQVEPLRKSLSLFTVDEVFDIVKRPNVTNEVMEPELVCRVFTGATKLKYPRWIIVDSSGFISKSRLEYSFVPLSDSEMAGLVLRRFQSERPKTLKAILKEWGFEIEKDSRGREILPSLDEILRSNIIITPVPRLTDPSFLKSMDWMKFINQLISFKVEKDKRLALIHKAHLFRGLNPFINPHALEVTNGGTGKSAFYDIVGINAGKVTASSFLGFAKSPEEIYPGIINESELPIGIDQIESQSAPQVMRFMFNALERGCDEVFAGAVRFRICTHSIIALLANTYVESSDPEKSFGALLDHIAFNPAIGRRIALIAYGNDYARVTTKPSPEILNEWHEAVSLFRAVEEYSQSSLKRIIKSSKVWQWLNQPLEKYTAQVNDLITGISSETARTFLEEHAAGSQVRIRGAALYATLVDNLAHIALNTYDINEILELADEYLPDYISINLNSIGTLSKEYEKELSYRKETVFNGLPDYLKEIVSAIELFRRSNPTEQSVIISSIKYKPKSEAYPTLNECLRMLTRRRNRENLQNTFEKIKALFAIDIVDKDGVWVATLLSPHPIDEIQILGSELKEGMLQ